MDIHALTSLIEDQKALMIAVAVGDSQIQNVQADYTKRRRTIAAELRRLGFGDPNPYSDLWDWYHYWKEPFLSWAERRKYVNGLYAELLDALDNLSERRLGSGLHEAATGWPKVDNQLAQLRERYATARTQEDFQAVGLLCRDLLISIGDACYDHDRHGDGKGKVPSSAMDKLEKVVGVEAAGGSNKQLRQLLKAAMEYANHVQHDREGTLDLTAIAAEATVAVLTLMRIVCVGAAPAEDDDPEPQPPSEAEPKVNWSELDIPF